MSKATTVRCHPAADRSVSETDQAAVPVISSPFLRRDEVLATPREILAERRRHVVHRIRMEGIKAEMRADLNRTLDAFAARVGVSR